jgi:uncharacterized membrane protein YedE/YeeE
MNRKKTKVPCRIKLLLLPQADIFMYELLTKPWPWYVSGPLIGLMVPALLIIGNKPFGISSTLRHICAACIPTKAHFFDYDWKSETWNIVFAVGIVFGAVIAGVVFKNPNPVAISGDTIAQLQAMGINQNTGLVPAEIFNFQSLLTARGLILMVGGGFLIGFGTRYAGGCTSGHSIMGLSNLQWPSLVATICFFAGGLLMSWFLLPQLIAL